MGGSPRPWGVSSQANLLPCKEHEQGSFSVRTHPKAVSMRNDAPVSTQAAQTDSRTEGAYAQIAQVRTERFWVLRSSAPSYRPFGAGTLARMDVGDTCWRPFRKGYSQTAACAEAFGALGVFWVGPRCGLVISSGTTTNGFVSSRNKGGAN